ncbi:MAG: hypothetical protein VX278_18300, partial [Myxococcota bacterium]|nr:hypothetical protein [Myxococcota bacterium]
GATLTLDPTLIGVGDTLTCTVSTEDGYGGTHSEDASVTILNTDPTVDSVEIDLETPVASDTITCSATASDIDGDSPTLSFSWSNLTSGDVYTSTSTTADSASLDLSTTSVSPDDEVGCVVTASDTDGGSASDSATVVVDNSPPQFDVEASIDISPDVYVNDVLTCSASASDRNDGAVTPTYEWSVNGNVFATGASYTVDATNTDYDDELVCTATATDADGESIVSTASVRVENTAPDVSNVQITSSSGFFYNDDVLTCSADVTDVDDNIIDTWYKWLLGSTSLAPGSTLDLSTVTVLPGDELICRVETTDSVYLGDLDSATVTLSNRAPALSPVTIDDTVPYADSTITCSATATDEDGETLTPTLEWTNGTTVLGSTASLTLTPSDAAVGDVITCTASVEDGYGGSDVSTATATVQNTEPMVSGTTLDLSTVYNDDTIVCSSSVTDLDETLGLSYE